MESMRYGVTQSFGSLPIAKVRLFCVVGTMKSDVCTTRNYHFAGVCQSLSNKRNQMQIQLHHVLEFFQERIHQFHLDSQSVEQHKTIHCLWQISRCNAAAAMNIKIFKILTCKFNCPSRTSTPCHIW